MFGRCSTIRQSVVGLLCLVHTAVHSQTGVTHQVSLNVNDTYSNHRNGQVPSTYGIEAMVTETHHLTKTIGVEGGLAYAFGNTHHTVNQISIRENKKFAYSTLQFHTLSAPINIRGYINKNSFLYSGVTIGTSLFDVTKVYDVEHPIKEDYDKSYRTLLNKDKGLYKKQLLGTMQLGYSYSLKLNTWHLLWGLEYARYLKPFEFTYYNQAYNYRASRITMRLGFWRE